MHDAWQNFIDETSVVTPNFTSSLTLQSIPAPPSNPSRANSLGFDPSSTPQKDLVLVLVSSFWDQPTVGSQITNATKDLIGEIEQLASGECILQPFIYENYAASSFQAPLQSTGQIDYFRDVARKYDPTGIFQGQLVGGWKLH